MIKDIFNNYAEKIKTKHQTIKQMEISWNEHANGILNIAKELEPEFILTEENKPILKLMLLYFSGNQLFESELKLTNQDKINFEIQKAKKDIENELALHNKIKQIEEKYTGNLNKGIFLIGSIGNGKSLLFRIFKEYTREIISANSYQMHDCIDIIDNCNISGVQYLERYSHNFEATTPKPITCYLDDIASKNETIKHYGTELNAIEQLLSLRYNVYQRYNKLTHGSTNKYPHELKSIYDMRVVDRMIEMFNFIEIKGKSFRK